MTQLALFSEEPGSARPLPAIIADENGFPLQSSDIDGLVFYSALDWLRGVMEKQNVKSDWKKAKATLQKGGVLTIHPLPYHTKGGIQVSDFVTDESLIVRETARLIAPGFHAMANYLNVDFLTGKSLLREGL